MKEEIEKDGYFIVKDFITEQEVKRFRELSDNYFKNYPTLLLDHFHGGRGGRAVPGWAGITPELEELNMFHEDSRMLAIAEELFGEGFVFAEHADLHQNKITGWHRDVQDYQHGSGTWPNWDKDFFVIKICLLLQDHMDNDYGLQMDVGSHRGVAEGNCLYLHSRATDAIVFDQRIRHAGQDKQYKDEHGQDRYLITLGYGLDNIETKKHIAGCRTRQNVQRAGGGLYVQQNYQL
ncbi:hypothetical protein CL634_10185 [bacterium]|nr:hypothetical protein [bacterium]|tara:strand:+ start:484 stop:1188 length:705 start_codon:yes stop_codon:yes gene_type:complete